MDKNDISRRVVEEEDYIRCPKCSNSLSKFLSKNPDGVGDVIIARLLMMPEEKIQQIYDEAIKQLREKMVEK